MSQDRFQNKYRITPARMPFWNYGWNGRYFVTICTAYREHFFGEIKDRKMILSSMGHCANKLWHDIPKHFPYAILDEFKVMPNHIHGIIEISKNIDGHYGGMDSIDRDTLNPNPSCNKQSGGATGNNNPMLNNNLARILRWYTGRCSFEIHKIHADFEWQKRFHDHIIRDDETLFKIRNYIRTNPEHWEEDCFYG